MRSLFFTIVLVLMAYAVVGLFGMGLDHINPEIGYGLHPGIAFPLATLLLCAKAMLIHWLIEPIEECYAETERLMVQRY